MAGKSDIVKGVAEAIADLPDVAKRWFTSLDETTGHRPEVLAKRPEFIEKVKNVAEEAPFAFSQYEPKILLLGILRCGCKVDEIFHLTIL